MHKFANVGPYEQPTTTHWAAPAAAAAVGGLLAVGAASASSAPASLGLAWLAADALFLAVLGTRHRHG